MNFFVNFTLKHILYLLFISMQVIYTPYIFTESNNTVPVIFINWGNPDFLKHSLWQAKQFNKRVILLGDPSTKHYTDLNIEWRNIEDYSKSSNYFASLYVHMSPHTYEFELRCFQRWFVLEEFMKVNNIPVAFYCDSDVMLYCNISREYEDNFKGYDVSLVSEPWYLKDWDKNGYKGALVSYWNIKGISSFTTYLKRYYSSKKRIAEALNKYNKAKGDLRTCHFDDFPLTMNFVKDERTNIKIGMINKIINDALFDYAIWAPLHQEEDGTNVSFNTKKYSDVCYPKDIQWINNLPHCYSPTLEKNLRFKSLHLQGKGCKSSIADYKIKNNA
jgi:hypothetical protein